MRHKIKCENSSSIYKKIKPKPIIYNGQKYELLLELNGISHIVKINSKNLPYGIIEKINSSDIFI
jgi:hypothetical protein